MAEEEQEIKYGWGAYLTEMDKLPGENAIFKGFQVGGKAAMAGGVYGATVAAIFDLPAGATPLPYAFKLIGANAALLGGVGATFAIVTTLATKIRDKDDYKSWAIGAATAGSLFGFRYRNLALGCKAAFGLGVLAGAIKYRHVYREPFYDSSAYFITPREEN